MAVPFTPRVEEARQFLAALFADGQARKTVDVLAAAHAACINRSAAHRAKNRLFIRAVRHKGGWYWEPQSKNEVKA